MYGLSLRKDGEWFMTEKCDVWSKPEKDGGWSKSEKEGVYSKPEKEGVYSKPEKGGICSKPERDDVCSKPEKDSNTNSALTLVPVCPLPSRWLHTPLNTGGGKRRELSPFPVQAMVNGGANDGSNIKTNYCSCVKYGPWPFTHIYLGVTRLP